MGAWGVGPFENDGAGEFEAALSREHHDHQALLRKAFDAALAESGYLELDMGQAVVAAAAVLACATGLDDPDIELPKTLKHAASAIEAGAVADLVPIALHALQRTTRSAATSELFELWLETSDFDMWKHTVDKLRDHLRTRESPPGA